MRSPIVWTCVFALLAGCGQSEQQRMLDRFYPDREPVFPVSGVVTVDGEPMKDLFLQLVPADATKPERTHPHTFTKEDGSFAFSTYSDGDGVKSGKYRMLVEQLKSSGPSYWKGPDGLGNQYNDLAVPAAHVDVSGNSNKNMRVELAFAGKSPRNPPSYGVSTLGNPARMKRSK